VQCVFYRVSEVLTEEEGETFEAIVRNFNIVQGAEIQDEILIFFLCFDFDVVYIWILTDELVS
jgi:hypothetical protein